MDDAASVALPPLVSQLSGVVTLAMVAQRAGVSKGTASRALNGHYGVSAQTRQMVLAAAEEMGFAHNEVARSLTTGRTGTVGLLTNDLEGRFALPIMLGAERALTGGPGASILLSNANGDSALEDRRLRGLLSRQVDGVLIVGDRSDARDPIATAVPLPVVYVYSPSRDPRDVSVVPDDEQGGYLAADHLLERGCRRIVHIAGEDSFIAAHDRDAGIRRRLAEQGIDLAAPTRFGIWEEEWGWEGVTAMVDSGTRFDGLICGSDYIARGALDALRSRNLELPRDVKMIGFDNMLHTSPRTRPPLTSIDLNLQGLGAAAADVLLEMCSGASRSGTITLPGSLIVREST